MATGGCHTAHETPGEVAVAAPQLMVFILPVFISGFHFSFLYDDLSGNFTKVTAVSATVSIRETAPESGTNNNVEARCGDGTPKHTVRVN